MQIPYEMLKSDTLRSLVEEFVTREGTDYGDREYSLDTKIGHVMRQLERGEATIVFDPDTESCSIVSTRDLN